MLLAPEFDSPKLLTWKELAAVAEARNEPDKALAKGESSGEPEAEASTLRRRITGESPPPVFVDTRCAPLHIDQ